MNARNGKIARLPRPVREELNLRLERSAESPELLDWLNGLPEVKDVLDAHFGGVPISKMNLSRWRQGGHREWLLREDLCGKAGRAAELSRELDNESHPKLLADDVATVVTARLGVLLAGWNGTVDKKFEAETRVLTGLGNCVVRLQREKQQARRRDLETVRATLTDQATATAPGPQNSEEVTVDNAG
jgi:hypothetical protein